MISDSYSPEMAVKTFTDEVYMLTHENVKRYVSYTFIHLHYFILEVYFCVGNCTFQLHLKVRIMNSNETNALLS